MYGTTSSPSERVAVAAVIAPGALTTGAKNSGWIDLSLYTSLMAVGVTGVLGAGATLDGKWQLADDNAGTNVIDAGGTNGVLAQVVKAGGDGKQFTHNFDPSKASVYTKRWARYVLTVGVATSDGCVIILGVDPRHQPATDYDPATVVQSV